MGGTPQFVDISAWQGHVDWPAYKQWASQWDGVSRVAMKATEGVGFIDPQFIANRAGALAAGIDCIIYYHFARHDLGNDPVAEANWLRQVVGDTRDQDMIILDYEVAGFSAADWVCHWLVQAQSNYGRAPGLYVSLSYIESRLQDARLAQFPLWLADWTFDPNMRPDCPGPWTSYSMLQYTDKASIPGIAGLVDADVFLSTQGESMQTYGPGRGDFDSYFVDNGNGTWTCKKSQAVIFGGNLGLYRQLSIDGLSLPVIGLPLESEQYDSGVSTQRFERGAMRYNPGDPNDRQPGVPGVSHLDFINYKAIDALPKALSDLATVQSQVEALQTQVATLQSQIDGTVIGDVKAMFDLAEKIKAAVSWVTVSQA